MVSKRYFFFTNKILKNTKINKNCFQNQAAIARSSRHFIPGITSELKMDYISQDYQCKNVTNTVQHNNEKYPTWIISDLQSNEGITDQSLPNGVKLNIVLNLLQ